MCVCAEFRRPTTSTKMLGESHIMQLVASQVGVANLLSWRRRDMAEVCVKECGTTAATKAAVSTTTTHTHI